MIKDVPIIYTIVIHRSFKTFDFFFFGYSSSISRFQVPVKLIFQVTLLIISFKKKKMKILYFTSLIQQHFVAL